MQKAGGARTFRRTKKRKTTPLSMAFSESETDGSPQDGSEIVHSATPLNTFNPANTGAEDGGSNQAIQSDDHAEEEAEHLNKGDDNVQHAATGTEVFVSTSRGFGRHIFPGRHSGGDEGVNLRTHLSPLEPFVPSWGLTTSSILNDVEQCHDMMINLATPSRYEALNDDYEELYEAHSTCNSLSQCLIDTQNSLVEAFHTRATLLEDHKVLQQIKRLEDALASKTSSLSEAEKTATQLKGDLERLTIDLSQAKVVRYNYVRYLLPTVIQRLHSSDEYKKSLFEPFNQAIVIGWSEGVKVDRIEEEAQAILADVDDYDLDCQATFKLDFDELFVKSYPYVERPVESYRLPLGDLQNMWLEGEWPTVGDGAING
nr:hypothetical protein [Tanacetum cinerariifolium]